MKKVMMILFLGFAVMVMWGGLSNNVAERIAYLTLYLLGVISAPFVMCIGEFTVKPLCRRHESRRYVIRSHNALYALMRKDSALTEFNDSDFGNLYTEFRMNLALHLKNYPSDIRNRRVRHCLLYEKKMEELRTTHR